MIDWTNLDDGTEPIYRANLLEYAEEKSLLNNLIDLCYSTGRIDSAVRQQLLLMVAERQYLTAYQMMSLIDGIMTRTGMLDEYKHLSEEAIEFLKGIVFVATYNETPFTEVVDAANAGKIVMVKKDGIQYYLSQLSNTVAYFYQTIGSNIYRVFVYSTDVWSTGTTSLVPSTLKVNNKQLNQDINLTASDVGARPDTWTPSASDVGAVPTTRTVNSKALSSDINLTASDVGAIPVTGAIVSGHSFSTNNRPITGDWANRNSVEGISTSGGFLSICRDAHTNGQLAFAKTGESYITAIYGDSLASKGAHALLKLPNTSGTLLCSSDVSSQASFFTKNASLAGFTLYNVSQRKWGAMRELRIRFAMTGNSSESVVLGTISEADRPIYSDAKLCGVAYNVNGNMSRRVHLEQNGNVMFFFKNSDGTGTIEASGTYTLTLVWMV